MSEYVHPDNPFAVTDNFKEVTPALINAAVETLAFVAVPCLGQTVEPLIVEVAQQWSIRMTGLGSEDVSHAVVWELCVHVARMMSQGIPFPPFDITSHCGDDECAVDHGEQTRLVNTLLEAARTGQHALAVKAFVAYVRRDDVAEWADSRAQYVAMLLAHVADRVSMFRSNQTDILPSLD